MELEIYQLRHTTATQLLNAGCPVTSIQKFLGHKKLNSTMIYARAYDKTVEADYFAAMGRIEQRLELVEEAEEPSAPVGESERGQLLSLAERLAEPELSRETRLGLVALILGVLNRQEMGQVKISTSQPARAEWIPPPSIPVLVNS